MKTGRWTERGLRVEEGAGEAGDGGKAEGRGGEKVLGWRAGQ